MISIAPVLYDDHRLCNPRVLIETDCQETVEWVQRFNIAGREFTVHFYEKEGSSEGTGEESRG